MVEGCTCKRCTGVDHEAMKITVDTLPCYPKKEKRMNLYTLTARKIISAEYLEVEAVDEDDAICRVEYGYVDSDYEELEEIQDIEVIDVQYGDIEYAGKLGVTIVVRGKLNEAKLRDAAYSLLQQFDGKRVQYGDAELELVGFNVDHIEEA